MVRSGMLALTALGLSLTSQAAARGTVTQEMIRGRTGLPAVREGEGNVWVHRGWVVLQASGKDVTITQQFHLKYPGAGIETGDQRIRVAVREDYFRKMPPGHAITTAEARGFNRFAVWLDGRSIESRSTEWELNDRKDTATRWREFWIGFKPGQLRTLRIVSTAPLGTRGGRHFVQFVSKDLGKWRAVPDMLEIRFKAPGTTEARLAGVEPDPDDISRNGVRWVYRKADPDRDIFVLLPAGRRTRR